MKLEVKAIIKGIDIATNNIFVNHNPYDLKLQKENDDIYICVYKKMIDYEEYITKVEIQNGTPCIIYTPKEAYMDLIAHLQFIESLGSFYWGIECINWSEPIITWIPEKEEERGIMPALSEGIKYRERKIKTINESKALNLLIYKKETKELTIPFSYYRQGKLFFDNRQYYFAYINFFMMLDYHFGNKQFKKDSLINEFNKAHILKKSITLLLKQLKSNEEFKTHLDWLNAECISRNKNVDISGLIYVLVEFRGLLSHASKKSEKYIFNNMLLYSLAFIISAICFNACAYLQFAYHLHGQRKEDYLNGVGEFALKECNE